MAATMGDEASAMETCRRLLEENRALRGLVRDLLPCYCYAECCGCDRNHECGVPAGLDDRAMEMGIEEGVM